MSKSIYFSDRENAEKRNREVTDPAQQTGFNQANSINRSASAMPVSMPDLSLALAIAVLSGCLLSATPVHAEFKIPTDKKPSPLCIGGKCATAFTAKMLMFEEFGLRKMPGPNSGSSKLTGVSGCRSNPNGADLDIFLKEEIHPFPTRLSDQTNQTNSVSLPNAWEARVESCVPLSAETPTFYDGRPGGEEFAHQRWDGPNGFFPETYFQSATTGARVNGGLRDDYQMHHYNKGEFGPRGLYYPTNGKNAGTAVRIHPNLPVQNVNSVWTFDGTLPPKLLMARYGEPVLFRHYNALPIDVTANNGFGKNTITTHEHNGHSPAESDGYTHAFFYPGQYYDYHWPMILAGHDSINIGAADSRAGAPDDHGGIDNVRGDWRETMSTHWFHDHMLDFTAQNVYKGNAAMMNYYSALDRGREPKDTTEASGNPSKPGYGCHYAAANPSPFNVNLCLPSGSGLDWGNRDYDVNLMVADKAWSNSGQLKFSIFNTDGFLGDRITVNWVYKPYLDVRARRYRFRILNASVSRSFKIAIVDEAGTKIPYHMIANDGNIMQHAVKFPIPLVTEALPEQGIAERYDIIVDFTGMPAGKKLYLVNVLEHEDGKGPNRVIPLANILNGSYVPDGTLGDPGVGKFLEFRVQNYTGSDLSMNPVDYTEGKKQMVPLNKATTTELKAAVHRTFGFGRASATDAEPQVQPWVIKTDDGVQGFNMDPHRLSAAPDLGKTEIWHIKLNGGGAAHPVHVHFEEGQILKRGGKAPPIWEKYARKDVYRIGPLSDSTDSVDIAIRFREFAGTYMEHCHNTQHEDKAMLLRWDIQNPGNTIAIPTPMPDWDGVSYDPSIPPLPTYKIGDVNAKKKFVLP